MTASATRALRNAPPPLPLQTDRLLLRTVRHEDAPSMRYYMDADVCRYLTVGPVDEAGMAARMERLVAATAPVEPDDVLGLAVVLGGRVIGDVMLRLKTRTSPEHPPSVGEIGWVFAPEVRGRGYATEAARGLVDLAFGHYGLHRVFALLDPRNVASARVCERLGMTKEAHLRRDWPEADGTWTDTAIYGLLREEWEEARAD